jgi:hypothetical protein
MFTPVVSTRFIIAQAPNQPKPPAKPKQQEGSIGNAIWIGTSGMLLLLVIGLAVFLKMKTTDFQKKLKFETLKNQELQKKLKLAAETITKMERNPDLVHSREFNLDYLRMRMAEERFNFAIVNQIKIKIKDRISVALRPNHAGDVQVGIASTGRLVDETFDVEYEPGDMPRGTKRVLFRIQVRLTKLPTQPTSVTVSQIIDCIEKYLSPSDENHTWQPTIQGRIAQLQWDQKAKPTPLLVLEQTSDGTNVTFRTTVNRRPATSSSPKQSPNKSVATGK